MRGFGFDHRLGHLNHSEWHQSPQALIPSGTLGRGPLYQHGCACHTERKDTCGGSPAGMCKVTEDLQPFSHAVRCPVRA